MSPKASNPKTAKAPAPVTAVDGPTVGGDGGRFLLEPPPQAAVMRHAQPSSAIARRRLNRRALRELGNGEIPISTALVPARVAACLSAISSVTITSWELACGGQRETPTLEAISARRRSPRRASSPVARKDNGG